MNGIETFWQAVETAVKAAADIGVDRVDIRRVLLGLAGLDPAACGDAADQLDQLIDGQDDDLAEQLAPARDILLQLTDR